MRWPRVQSAVEAVADGLYHKVENDDFKVYRAPGDIIRIDIKADAVESERPIRTKGGTT